MKHKCLKNRFQFNIIFIIFLIAVNSCNQKNRINADEQQLADQILKDDKNKAGSFTDEQNNEAIPDSSFGGIRYLPERSIDPLKPPEIIDIAGNQDKISVFKLSDIANSIEYIRLQFPVDSAFFGNLNTYNAPPLLKNEQLNKEELPFTIVKNKNFIIAYNYLGMLLYNTKGQLLRIICTNEFTGISLSKASVVGGSSSTFIGAMGKPRFLNNKLYYNYFDDVNNISRMVEVDCYNLPIKLPQDPEKKKSITGLGNPVANTGNKSYSAIALGAGLFSKNGHPKNNEDMLTIYNSRGDTLCSFPGNQKVKDYAHSVFRNTDFGSQLTFKGELYFREALSDTIFKVIPPNSLGPSFILNLGEYKIKNIQDAMSPGYDLSNKITIKSISFNDNFVFIFYALGYDSPNARRNKSVEYHHCIYERKTQKLWHAEADPFNYYFALENDLDGGLPIWPGKFSYKYYTTSSISESGEIIQSLKGNDLKKYIQSDEFRNSDAPSSKKEQLKKLAESVDEYETIVMVIK